MRPKSFQGSKFLAMLAALILLQVSSISAQAIAKKLDKDMPLPFQERFVKSSQLIVPWIHSSCIAGLDGMCEERGEEISRNTIVSLYNRDGSKWYEFDLQYNAGGFQIEKKPGFLPFASALRAISSTILLRQVSESPNWYEVEINEETQETKFVPKNMKMWGKTTWAVWIHRGKTIEIRPDEESQVFYDAPDGKPIERIVTIPTEQARVLSVEGDWVKFEIGPDFAGWVKWRDGRKILIGCAYNDHTIPE